MNSPHPPFKLTIELVPATSWYNNLRNAMGREKWDVLRRKVYADYHNQCGICHAPGLLHCHEIWAYDDENHIQTLKGFIALCPLCHWVKHIGLAGIRASEGTLDFEKIVQHFMKVNNCNRQAFKIHRENAFALWEKRSKHQWKIEIAIMPRETP